MQADPLCPLCGKSCAPPVTVDVCSACHDSIQTAGLGNLAVTGEFEAISELEAQRILGNEAAPPTAAVGGCSWCGKAQSQVKKLLSSRGAMICNECVALCADVLSVELGPDWRGN